MSLRAFEIADLLASLSDKSLADFDEKTGRYRLLELVRQYAADRLDVGGEAVVRRHAHLSYFLAMAKEAQPHLSGAQHVEWFTRLEADHDNLRAALEQGSGASCSAEEGLSLAVALWEFWWVGGHLGEGRSWLSRLLSAGPSGSTASAIRATALRSAGVLAHGQGDYASARKYDEESLAITREVGDRHGIAASLHNLGTMAIGQGDYAAARKLCEESLQIFRELGYRRSVASSLINIGTVALDQGDWTAATRPYEESLAIARELGDRQIIATSLDNLGRVAIGHRDYASARKLSEESLAIRRELGHQKGIAWSLQHLGCVAHEQGDYGGACRLYEESLAITCELDDRQGIAVSLEGLAAIVAALGDAARASSIWGAAERLRQEIGVPLAPCDQPAYEQMVAASRAALGDDAAFDAAWQHGRAMALEEAVAHALEETNSE